MNTQITLILIGSICLAVALGIKIGRLTFKHMATKTKENFDFQILFHTDAHPIGEHGTMYVDCAARKWKAEPISFVFVGVPASPQMSLDLMKKIWDDAERAGYIPLSLRTYVQVYGTTAKPPMATQDARESMIAANNRRKTNQMRETKATDTDRKIYDASVPQQQSA